MKMETTTKAIDDATKKAGYRRNQETAPSPPNQASPPGFAHWVLSLGIVVFNFLLFFNSQPVSNNFDLCKYFVFYLILPPAGLLLLITALQRFVNPRVLTRFFAWAGTLSILALGLLALGFESYNGDDVMYITAYLAVYHPVTYDASLSTSVVLLYLTSLGQVRGSRVRDTPLQTTLLGVYKGVIYAFGLSFALLLVAQRVGLGVSLLAQGILLGLVGVHALDARVELKYSLESRDAPGKGAWKRTRTQPSSRAKNALVVLLLTLTSLLAGYLFPINFVRYAWYGGEGGVTMYYELNKKQAMDEMMLGLAVFVVVAVLAFGLVKRWLGKLAGKKDPEGGLSGVTFGLLALLWGLLNLGGLYLPVRYSSLVVPWVFAGILLLLATWFSRRDRESPGLLGAVSVALCVGTWGGLALGAEPDSSYAGWLITAILGVVILLAVLVYGVLDPRFLHHGPHSGTLERGNPRWRAGSLEVGASRDVGREVKVSLASALVITALVLVPVFAIPVAVSRSEFQLLANVDNNCLFYRADSTTRVGRDYRPSFGLGILANPNNKVQISAARNEYESFQVVMLPINKRTFSIYDISFSGFVHDVDGSVIESNDDNFKAYIVQYVDELSGIVPDKLVEFQPFGASDGKNHPLWFTFYVPANATAGDYTGTLEFEVDNQTAPLDWYRPEVVEVEVHLHVWNFRLPDTPTLKSNFGLWGDKPGILSLFKSHRMMQWAFASWPQCNLTAAGEVDAIDYTKFEAEVQWFHGNGTHTIGLHDSISSIFPAATFVVQGVTYNANNYTAAPTYEKCVRDYFREFEAFLRGKWFTDDFGRNVTWYDEVYFNGRDEIQAKSAEEQEEAFDLYDFLKEKAGMTLPIMQTVMGDHHRPEIESRVDILCVHTSGREHQYMADWKDEGHEMWIYTTCGPRFASPTISTSTMATQVRAIGWQCFKYNYTHYLIWDVVTPYNARDGYGYQGWNGGSLMYTSPGGYADGYVMSTRMELVREGFEDHDYFYLLRASHANHEKSNPDSPLVTRGHGLLERVNSLMDGYQPEMDYRKVNALRNAVGNFLGDASILR
ncbi:MAG: glycoside hydrolase domain-containing protein [Promethearchaeota archaeon]